MKRAVLFATLCLTTALAASADVRLPKLLESHMVLQRDQPVHLWGWAEPGEKVSAEMNGKSHSTLTDAYGHWHIYLPAFTAGGPFSLTIKGTNEIDLNDVLIGDVWFASGQSNMEMPLKGFPGNAVIKNSDLEIRNAGHKGIRLFRTPRRASDYPLPDYQADWTECTPETAADFSAVAYFFGRQIAQDEHVPIGLIDSTWGGTPAEAWISMDGLGADASLISVFADWARMANDTAEIPALLKAEKLADEQAQIAGQPKPPHTWHPAPESWAPAGLYNGMVAAALNFRIKGVIWYQGESNSGLDRANLYERVFPALIADWRTHWQQGNFPFLFVQLANYAAGPNESYNTIREAQRRTLSVANTGMAVTIDIGLPENVHPSDKQDVGARLALAAEAIAYGKKLEYSGPLFREISSDTGVIRVWFDHTTGGLKATGDALTGFEIAGSDRKYVSAHAQIEGDTVLLSADGVTAPKYVRYGWANAPTLDLVNGAGLPASPFISEERIPIVGLNH
jgi:sialate O-acetylesterase